jgi:hypothetical protein
MPVDPAVPRPELSRTDELNMYTLMRFYALAEKRKFDVFHDPYPHSMMIDLPPEPASL